MKKVSLFFDKSVRDGLHEFSAKEGMVAFSAALDFFAKVVAFLHDPRAFQMEVLGPGHEHRDPIERFHCMCYAEGKYFHEEFSKAHRVEACLRRQMGIIVLELYAYNSGEKTPFRTMSFSVFERYAASRNIPARQ